MASVKNLPAILKKIREGTAPEKFTIAHLKDLGFTSSNDQGIIPLLKELGFLSSDGTPTKRYLEFRDESKAQIILGQALKEAYSELFHINEKPTEKDRKAIIGKFKSTHNVKDSVASKQATTFFALMKEADIESGMPVTEPSEESPVVIEKKQQEINRPLSASFSGFRYNIEIHLPATKDIEVYNAIFKSIKEHLINE
jgi:hypothetical protein